MICRPARPVSPTRLTIGDESPGLSSCHGPIPLTSPLAGCGWRWMLRRAPACSSTPMAPSSFLSLFVSLAAVAGFLARSGSHLCCSGHDRAPPLSLPTPMGNLTRCTISRSRSRSLGAEESGWTPVRQQWTSAFLKQQQQKLAAAV